MNELTSKSRSDSGHEPVSEAVFPWTGHLPELADVLATRLRKSMDVDSIWLFGSVARGTADSDSDLDLLAVVPDSNLTRYQRAVAALKLLVDIRVPKDVIVLTRKEWESQLNVNTSLASSVVREGRLLYGR